MNSAVVFVLLAVGLAAVSAVNVKEQFYTQTFPTDVLTNSIGCVKGKLALVEPFVEKVKECLPGLSQHYGTKEGQHPNECALFCQAHSINTLGGDDLPKFELYKDYINVALPEAFKARVVDHVHNCFANHGAKVNHEDATCAGAGTLNTCIFTIFEWEC